MKMNKEIKNRGIPEISNNISCRIFFFNFADKNNDQKKREKKKKKEITLPMPIGPSLT